MEPNPPRRTNTVTIAIVVGVLVLALLCCCAMIVSGAVAHFMFSGPTTRTEYSYPSYEYVPRQSAPDLSIPRLTLPDTVIVLPELPGPLPELAVPVVLAPDQP